MALAHDETGLLDADLGDVEEAGIEVVRYAGDDEILPCGEQFAGKHVARFHAHIHLDAGIGGADLLDRRNGKADRRRGHRSEEDRAAGAGFQRGKLAVDLAQFEQDGARPAGEGPAEGGERDAARDALAKLGLEDRLHFRQHARGGGLGYVERIGRRAHLLVRLYGRDHAQVAELQPAAQEADPLQAVEALVGEELVSGVVKAHGSYPQK